MPVVGPRKCAPRTEWRDSERLPPSLQVVGTRARANAERPDATPANFLAARAGDDLAAPRSPGQSLTSSPIVNVTHRVDDWTLPCLEYVPRDAT